MDLIDRCTYQDESGPCQATPQRESDGDGHARYCFWHDPTKVAEQAEARKKGGRNSHRRLSPAIPDAQPPRSAQEVSDLLARVMASVLRGETDPKIMSTLAYGANVLIKAFEAADVAKRLEALEAGVSKAKQQRTEA